MSDLVKELIDAAAPEIWGAIGDETPYRVEAQAYQVEAQVRKAVIAVLATLAQHEELFFKDLPYLVDEIREMG